MIANDNKELKLLDKIAREFSRDELAQDREENDKFPYGSFFDSTLKKAFTLDFFHSILPETCNGLGQGMDCLCVLLENICREDSSLGNIIFTNSAAHEILLAADNEDLLIKIVEQGDKINDFLTAFPVFNNPLEGELLVQAKKQGEGYSLSGSLEYIVLGTIGGQAVVPAVMDDIKGYSFFLIDLDQNGLEISQPVYSLGLHACPAVDIELNSIQGTLIGEQGQGAVYFEKMVSKLSVAAASMALGIMKGSFNEALDYSQKRSQGGREIINWSEVRMLLADMAIKVKTAEMIVLAACQAVDRKGNGWEACSTGAAIQIQEMACDLTTDGIQVMGGVGYMKDFGQEKRFRDAKQLQTLFGITPMKKLNYLNRIL